MKREKAGFGRRFMKVVAASIAAVLGVMLLPPHAPCVHAQESGATAGDGFGMSLFDEIPSVYSASKHE